MPTLAERVVSRMYGNDPFSIWPSIERTMAFGMSE